MLTDIAELRFHDVLLATVKETQIHNLNDRTANWLENPESQTFYYIQSL